jgi:hypothetical protein
MSFDRELSGNTHESILDDVWGGFVSNQEDGVIEGNAWQAVCDGVQFR